MKDCNMQFRMSLITKLTLATSVILVGFMWTLDSFNLKYFRNIMTEYAISNAEQIAEVINQSAYDAMMKNDKEQLYKVINQIGDSKSIEHIRLIDREGKVVISSTKQEIGMIITMTSEACVMCHKSGNPRLYASSMHRSRLFTTTAGKEVLGLTKAIYNQPSCSTAACHFHNSNFNVLGVLDITISLDNMLQKSHEYRMQFIIMTFILLLLIGVLLNFLTQRLINRPVKRLVRHTTLVSAGNLEVRVPVSSQDELGELSSAVNRMTESLQKAHEELKEWGSNLEQKVEARSREIKLIQTQLYRSEKLASLGQLVAGIAHEINNPLTGVLLFSSIVNSDKRLDPALKSDLERVIAETSRCADIVKRLLEFSRETAAQREPLSLEELFDKVVGLMYHQPCFHDINITKNYTPNLPNVIADPGQIQQVFMNLLINACHAMSGGGELTLSTSLSTDGTFVIAEVRDTGCGISEEDMNRIFDPFFTTKDEGTGLGLSISYGIVVNNGGNLEVKSRIGEGTVFTIVLPAYNEDATDNLTD